MHTAMVVRSAWLLMTRPGITDITGVELGRAEQRRARREGRGPPAVRVVRIRRFGDQPPPEPSTTPAARAHP